MQQFLMFWICLKFYCFAFLSAKTVKLTDDQTFDKPFINCIFTDVDAGADDFQ